MRSASPAAGFVLRARLAPHSFGMGKHEYHPERPCELLPRALGDQSDTNVDLPLSRDPVATRGRLTDRLAVKAGAAALFRPAVS